MQQSRDDTSGNIKVSQSWIISSGSRYFYIQLQWSGKHSRKHSCFRKSVLSHVLLLVKVFPCPCTGIFYLFVDFLFVETKNCCINNRKDLCNGILLLCLFFSYCPFPHVKIYICIFYIPICP